MERQGSATSAKKRSKLPLSEFRRYAVSPPAANRTTQGRNALSRLQHQLRPQIARPTRRGSPFSANVL